MWELREWWAAFGSLIPHINNSGDTEEMNLRTIQLFQKHFLTTWQAATGLTAPLDAKRFMSSVSLELLMRGMSAPIAAHH
ncbi:unnamed protein product [Leptidea sinapis]|uniref:Uncharacterized protein n=1 Tax=Leptidea sinapis TaxID=189913 RepID=A0A5E4R3J5_9NEOP|nr:unnamed protein product [Leptidea sinapis]